MTDPVTDSMSHRIENKVIALLDAETDLAELVAIFRGEPGPSLPVSIYPFGIVYLSAEAEAIGQEGFGQETGNRYFRYDGYVSIEALLKDIAGIAQLLEVGRIVAVPSYDLSRRLTQAARQALEAWGGEDGRRVEEDPVTSQDGKEVTVELRMDVITNALQQRPDNVSNRGNVEFHLYTRRRDY